MGDIGAIRDQLFGYEGEQTPTHTSGWIIEDPIGALQKRQVVFNLGTIASGFLNAKDGLISDLFLEQLELPSEQESVGTKEAPRIPSADREARRWLLQSWRESAKGSTPPARPGQWHPKAFYLAMQACQA